MAFTKTLLAATFGLLLVSVPICSVQAQTDEPAIKVTDSKLHPINYGIDSLEHWVQKAAIGDSKRTATLLRDLEKLENRFGRLPSSENEQYKYVSNRLKEMRAAIEKRSAQPEETGTPSNQSDTAENKTASVKPHPAIRGIASLLSGLEQDLERYQDNNKQRSRIRNDISTIKQRFARVPASEHPEYVSTRKRIADIESALQPAGGPLEMNEQQVSEYVESIRLKYSEKLRLPEARDIMTNRELTAEDVDGIVSRMKAFGENVDQDLPKLRRVVEATGQGEYWLKWLEKDSTEQLKRNMESIKKLIDNRIDSGLRNAQHRSSLDPEKNKYAFTNETMRKQHEADHARTLRTLEQATRLEKLLDLPATWSPKIDEMKGYVAAYQSKAVSAATVRDLPAEIGTKGHREIAQKVFQDEKYGVGKIARLIVNSKPVPRDRIEHKEFNGNIETIIREWNEFQVTTVEKENGKLVVYTNNLAKFSRAPRTTPIDKWILMQRFKRGEISQDDFQASQE